MRQIKIFNTLTGKKDLIKPMKGRKINMFVCGPTIYDYSHIGHAKTYILFDTFAKFLKQSGYSVFYLQNITDIDDKIIARARERGVLAKDLALAFEKEYLKDIKKLGVNSVSKYARATGYMKEIINQVQRLEKKGFAYKIEGDGIYYNIAKFKDYGKFARRTISAAQDATSRIDYSVQKINRGDFCLWKLKQFEEEPSWKSPWGDGRPGWHIEDTAITERFFGAQYDIHGGAIELMFPHHQAEISQMEAISGKKPLVKYWMHTGLLTVNSQKMSKSLGNFITIQDFLKRFTPNQIRFLILKTLWSSPIDYSDSAMIEVKANLDRIEDFLRKAKSVKTKTGNKETKDLAKKFKENFYKELSDDFNTPKAFAVMFEFIKNTIALIDQNLVSAKTAKEIYTAFEEINKIFGIIDFKKIKVSVPAEIKEMAKQRELARQSKDWAKADQLRAEIERQGFAIEDTPSGPALKRI